MRWAGRAGGTAGVVDVFEVVLHVDLLCEHRRELHAKGAFAPWLLLFTFGLMVGVAQSGAALCAVHDDGFGFGVGVHVYSLFASS